MTPLREPQGTFFSKRRYFLISVAEALKAQEPFFSRQMYRSSENKYQFLFCDNSRFIREIRVQAIRVQSPSSAFTQFVFNSHSTAVDCRPYPYIRVFQQSNFP
jgi:hypothetical protein